MHALFSHYTETLGLDIDTHLMRIIYLPSKRADLLHKVSQHVWTRSTRTAVKLLAVILGKIFHASQVAPCSESISFFLQECLNVHVKHFGTRKAWSKYRQVYINSSAAFALNLLKSLLQCESLHIWSRPIGLLVKRDPTFFQLTDASTKGLGGVCFDALDFQWRCSSSLFALDRDPETYETFEEHDPKSSHQYSRIHCHRYSCLLRHSQDERKVNPNILSYPKPVLPIIPLPFHGCVMPLAHDACLSEIWHNFSLLCFFTLTPFSLPIVRAIIFRGWRIFTQMLFPGPKCAHHTTTFSTLNACGTFHVITCHAS